MGKPKRKAQIQPDEPADRAPRRRAPQLEAEPEVPAAPPVDLKLDPDYRAFACYLAFDLGWVVEPGDLIWSYEGEMVTVTKPDGIGTLTSRSSARLSPLKAPALISEIRRRWGDAVGEKVARYVSPAAPPEPPAVPNRFLRQLTHQALTGGATREAIEASLVELVRRCADLARKANIGDTSNGASFTRQVAGAAILDLIAPGSTS